jgi:hypothetical protein
MELVEIRDAEQQQQMLELLREGFPQATFDWSIAFRAPPGQNGHGLLLVENGSPQGGILLFEKTETIRGREQRIVNLSSWYIRPQYRRLAVRMMRAVSAEADTIHTICTPIRSVQTICLRVGWRYLTRGSIASVPLLNGFAAECGIGVEPFRPGALQGERQRWMTDHVSAGHIGLIIRRGAQAIPTLWMRGLKVKELPAARLMFAADYPLLRAALPAIHAHMLRRHGIFGLYLPRIAPLEGLRGIRKRNKGPSIIVKGEVADEDVNLLYSELFYLPLGERAGGEDASLKPAGIRAEP